MKTSESIKELSAALSKAQSKLKVADKGAVNPHFRSKYADLQSVWDACREALTSNGLSVTQGLTSTSSGWVLTTILMHSTGEFIENETPLLLPQSPNMQHLASATTYGKRLALQAIVGISVGEVDDDGEENRKAIELRTAESKKEQEEFKLLLTKLRGGLKGAGLEDKLLEYGRMKCQELEMSGTDFFKVCLADIELFLENYTEYLGKK